MLRLPPEENAVGEQTRSRPTATAAALACSVVTISIPCSVAAVISAHGFRERGVLSDAGREARQQAGQQN
jgi:hypothetical protein